MILYCVRISYRTNGRLAAVRETVVNRTKKKKKSLILKKKQYFFFYNNNLYTSVNLLLCVYKTQRCTNTSRATVNVNRPFKNEYVGGPIMKYENSSVGSYHFCYGSYLCVRRFRHPARTSPVISATTCFFSISCRFRLSFWIPIVAMCVIYVIVYRGDFQRFFSVLEKRISRLETRFEQFFPIPNVI